MRGAILLWGLPNGVHCHSGFSSRGRRRQFRRGDPRWIRNRSPDRLHPVAISHRRPGQCRPRWLAAVRKRRPLGTRVVPQKQRPPRRPRCRNQSRRGQAPLLCRESNRPLLCTANCHRKRWGVARDQGSSEPRTPQSGSLSTLLTVQRCRPLTHQCAGPTRWPRACRHRPQLHRWSWHRHTV